MKKFRKIRIQIYGYVGAFSLSALVVFIIHTFFAEVWNRLIPGMYVNPELGVVVTLFIMMISALIQDDIIYYKLHGDE